VLEWVMPGIAAVKQGQLAVGRQHLLAAAAALRNRGADVLMLGCTEIPVVLDVAGVGGPVVDASAALARRAVACALASPASEKPDRVA
jgi:aspartate racemase